MNLSKVYQQLTKYDFKYGILEERDITMKTTKRILALFTAFVLCLAPMVLLVEASSTVCPHYQTVDIVRGSPSRTYRVASEKGCYATEYENSYYYCELCDHRWEGTYIVYSRHHLAANGVCAYCGYDSNND